MSTPNWHKLAETLDLSVANRIDGRSIPSRCNDQKTTDITKYSPQDGALLYQFSKGTSAEANQAVNAARTSFNDGRWCKLPLSKRAAALNRLADLVELHREKLACYECLDVGKPITNALKSDIGAVIFRFRNAAMLSQQLTVKTSADLGDFCYQRIKPLGVVAGIVGWNFPLSLASSIVAPALLMGNSVVIKPSEFTSLSTQHLADLALEAGVPPGVFNVIHGAGSIVGAALAAHHDVDMLSFVGSSATGKKIMAAAGESNMKKVNLECGGKSPFIVFEDCPNDLDSLAQKIVSKAFANQGAVCVSASRLLIHHSLRDALLPLIKEKSAAITPADPLDPSSEFGAIINQAHLEKVLAYIQSGVEEGADLILGGKSIKLEGELKNGYYIPPTILDQVGPQFKVAQEEIFGPVLSVLTFSTEEEAITLANNTIFGLSANVATTNLARAQRMGEKINSGRLNIFANLPSTGGAPNIGSEKYGQSGLGYSGGIDGLKAYGSLITVSVMT